MSKDTKESDGRGRTEVVTRHRSSADSTRPGRPKLRRIASTVAVVGVLVVAAAAADIAARSAAEGLVSRDIQAATGSADEPRVDIGGRLFLPQLVRGAYDSAHIEVTGLDEGSLHVDQIAADLTDLRVPFHDVLVRDVRAIGIGHSEETVRLSYPALDAYFDATGRPLTLTSAPGGAVAVTGQVTVLDQHLSATADIDLRVADGNLRLVPSTITSSNPGLGATARLLLTQRLTLTVPLTGLPFSQQLNRVDATPDGLVIRARGDSVVLRP